MNRFILASVVAGILLIQLPPSSFAVDQQNADTLEIDFNAFKGVDVPKGMNFSNLEMEACGNLEAQDSAFKLNLGKATAVCVKKDKRASGTSNKGAGPKGMVVCNKNKYKVWFAWGRNATTKKYRKDRKFSKGWYEIPANRCQRILKNLSDKKDRDEYYWYASSYEWGNRTDTTAWKEERWYYYSSYVALCFDVASSPETHLGTHKKCPTRDGGTWMRQKVNTVKRRGKQFILINISKRKRSPGPDFYKYKPKDRR